MHAYPNGVTFEENANRLERYNRNHKKQPAMVNICLARANWNACDYIDYNKQEYCAQGAECWKQDARHNCCYCSRQARREAI